MSVPGDLEYTKTHEWIRREGDLAVVGITDHAQEELGDIVFVELPDQGVSFDAGASFGVVESVKAVSDLYSPVGGEVVEVNESKRYPREGERGPLWGGVDDQGAHRERRRSPLRPRVRAAPRRRVRVGKCCSPASRTRA